ncbi:MAG: tRNA (adenosine(37)-N6)-threonylcarbamoyltransferase complex ATPase subunit type 1 TsaE [Chloroflexota bacterium]|nr:tRNA (adenosine(37)-N6)-threonylcarbamoyltransferase complex ATPase subunit type 1 TsaE [Chloroflexota bacterium]MDE3192354.1 tRNA (adenosine(37)-N6)-threonylcarbamoyltransferase complex ATPase subunit type 1 TsaE [Chloroflexota bacterium]
MTRAAADAVVRTRSTAETEALGERIGRAAAPGDVVALWGELGSGKTTLVRGIARGLGVPDRAVTSPTFVIVHEHDDGRLPLFHVDLYRLAPGDVPSTGWDEALSSGGVTAIEWPDRVATLLPAERLDVHLSAGGGDEREIKLEAAGPQARRLLEAAAA